MPRSAEDGGLPTNREAAERLLNRFHAAQNDYYAGGSEDQLRRLLAPDITWTVPGENLIAGTYRGIDEVFGYFDRRRDLADGSFQIEQRDVLVGAGNRIVALNDGSAMISGIRHRWSTVGLYEVLGEQIAACWLLPLDPAGFDAIWSA